MNASAGPFAIGVDIGGTFTDVVCLDPAGHMRLLKLPTTPRNPSAGAIEAIGFMRRQWHIPPDAIARFVHGTTIATNAVLERKGARIGLITTAGFKDVLEIGRQMRRAMYDLVLQPETPVFLAPGAFRKEVPERIGPAGRGAGAARRGGGRAARSASLRRRGSRRSRSATCSRSSTRRTSCAPERSSAICIPS